MKLLFNFLCCFATTVIYAQPTLVSAEYFIGNDPGVGNATALAVTPGNTLNETFEISLPELEEGFHFLKIRAKNADNKWSVFAKRMFYVTTFSNDESIVSAEYFIGEDPGVGNATPLEITQGDSVEETFSIPINDLENGFHTLNIRVKDSNNKWSCYAKKMFLVAPSVGEQDIIAAEYFIDEDPGIGGGEFIEILPGPGMDEILAIQLPDTLINGTHFLHIRVKNSNQKWSLYSRNSFLVGESSGVEDLFSSIEIYPNPAKETLFIKSEDLNPEQIKILDLNGKLVMNISEVENSVDISHLSTGIYLIQIFSEKGAISKTIIKQ